MKMIVAVDKEGGFGKDGKIPWYFKCDFAHFKNMTDGKICIMGKNTYLDMIEIMEKRKPIGEHILPNRVSYVLSSTLAEAKGATVINDVSQVIEKHDKNDIMIIGGKTLYEEWLDLADIIYVTHIDKTYDCDVFFPIIKLADMFVVASEREEIENGIKLRFIEYSKKKNK